MCFVLVSRYQDMTDTFKDVLYVPGGATLNAIKVAQVCTDFILIQFKLK